jgi:Flp pilus assembly pilin Flp
MEKCRLNPDIHDMRAHRNDERGASLVGYALIVVLIGGIGASALGYVGRGTSDAFFAIGNGLGGDVLDEPQPELTPEEKWAKAQEDYSKAVEDAKAQKAYDLAAAKADYDNAIAKNKSLPKNERKAANQQAKAEQSQAKADANANYKASVAKAKADRDSAKAEYKATK